MKKLDKKFYMKPALEVAPLLLGKYLCTRLACGEIIKKKIVEVEAYVGEEDTACHAHHGKTNRNKIIYENGGYTYIYLCYGIHNLLNVVTGKKDHPEAILIRGIEGAIGPGRVTKMMQIDRSLNEIDLTNSLDIWIEDDGFSYEYTKDKRVGIDYATPYYRDIQWRFILKDNN